MGKVIYLATLAVIALSALVAGWLWLGSMPSEGVETTAPDGLESFVAAGCWQCHQVGDQQGHIQAAIGPQPGQQSAYGPDLSGIGGLYPDAWHVAHLFEPTTVVGGSQMPRQSHLFDPGTRVLNARGRGVIAFLQGLRGPTNLRQPLPQGQHSTLLAPDVGRGGALFQSYCAGCHGKQGRGDGPAAAFFTAIKPANLAAGDIKRKAGPTPTVNDIFTTLTNGITQTGMPSFQNLPEQDRADLAALALSLKP